MTFKRRRLAASTAAALSTTIRPRAEKSTDIGPRFWDTVVLAFEDLLYNLRIADHVASASAITLSLSDATKAGSVSTAVTSSDSSAVMVNADALVSSP